MIYLRQSTASQEVLLGPFLDDTDGKTAETGLTIANTDIKVWKRGGTTEASKNSGGATHIASGRYYCTLDSTDTDTVGELLINVHVSGALPVRLVCCVLEEAVFDALFAASAAGYQVPIWSSASATVNLSGTTIKTLTDAPSDSTGVTTLLTKILGTLDTGTHKPQTGDGYAILAHVTYGLAALKTLLDAILDDTGTSGVALSAATCNKIADHVRRRTQANVEASSDGDSLNVRSLYGFVQQAQKSDIAGGVMTVKKTDGTTLGTLTPTSNPSADPITGVS